MHIHTTRVLLRNIEPDDLPRIYEYRNDWETVSHLGGFSLGMSKADAAAWIERQRNNSADQLWAIADRETNVCFGHVGLYKIDHRLGNAEFAICIGRSERWGQGIGAEVLQAVLRFAFLEMNLRLIYLEVLQTNERAIRLYEKTGFQREGLLRDRQYRAGEFVSVVVMSLRREEWTGQ